MAKLQAFDAIDAVATSELAARFDLPPPAEAAPAPPPPARPRCVWLIDVATGRPVCSWVLE